MSTETNVAVRELTDAELSAASGGATKVDFEFLGFRIFLSSDDDWTVACIADSQTYSCVTTVGGQSYSSSGPVPR
jgi:hypothetical protein